jgi:hypothetical protein
VEAISTTDSEIHFLPEPFSLKQLAGKVKEGIVAETAARESRSEGRELKCPEFRSFPRCLPGTKQGLVSLTPQQQ